MSALRSVLSATLLTTSLALACLWNSETVVREEVPFPTDMELLSGDFPRHSEAYYHWVVHRYDSLIREPRRINPADHDELASAYDKLGHHDSAVAVMIRKRGLYSNTYETMANLGTFLFHSGKLAEGLPYIDTAIRMNPDAHFGREVYQRYLVDYFLRQQKALPMEPTTPAGKAEKGYAAFVAQQLGVTRLDVEQRKKAIKGVLGMMRFGDYTSPVLLEAWADLERGYRDDEALSRAALGYLEASHRSKGATAKAYRDLLKELPRSQNLTTLERKLATYRASAQARLAKTSASEKKWIKQGVAVDSAYRVTYLEIKRRRAYARGRR